MHIEVPHSLGKQEAIRRVDGAIDQALSLPLPGGIAIKDLKKDWVGDVANVSLRITKMFFGATVSGKIDVRDSSMIIDVELPAMLAALMPGQDKVKDAIVHRLA